MITVIGLGFVGLTTALGFAAKNCRVYGYDNNREKLASIEAGEIPFYEPHLREVLCSTNQKFFFPTQEPDKAIKESKVVIFCVGTPCGDDGSADLSHLLSAIDETLGLMKKGDFKVLVIKSTVPPSTTKEIIRPFIEKRGFVIGKDVGLANNPEFLREGYAWDDFINPDRIILGVEDERSAAILTEIYRPFQAPLFTVSLSTGEFVKYLSNTLLATLISFSNEMSMVADAIGDIDVKSAFRILHLDRRWSGDPASMTTYAYPGCGYGGYCLPKDTQALYAQSSRHGFSPFILKEVIQTNDKIKDFIVSKVEKQIGKDKTIGILGLSFKPGSDDVRDTPAAALIELLLKRGFSGIMAFDPLALEQFQKAYALPVTYASSLDEICRKADALIIATGWDEFKDSSRFQGKPVFDYRYIL